MTIEVVRGPVDPRPRARSTDGRVIYAIGAIEGRYDLLAAMLATIVGDVASQPEEVVPLLVFLGNHLGDEAAEVLSALVWLSRATHVEVRALRGAAEEALLALLDHGHRRDAGEDRAGTAIFRSYGATVATDDLADHIPASHLALLRAMPVATTCGDYDFRWRQDGRGRARTTVCAATTVVAPDRIGLGATHGLNVLRLENAKAEILCALPVGTRRAMSAPEDRVAADESTPSMRVALKRLRPGF